MTLAPPKGKYNTNNSKKQKTHKPYTNKPKINHKHKPQNKLCSSQMVERSGDPDKHTMMMMMTSYSQAFTHPSTNEALRCLTSVIRREPVFSTWYGRRHLVY